MKIQHFRTTVVILLLLFLLAGTSFAGDPGGTVTFTITVSAPPESRAVKLWFPYPTSGTEQEITDLAFDGNYSNFTISQEPKSRALYLFAEWSEPVKDRSISVTFHAKAKKRKVANLVEKNIAMPPDVMKYVQAEFWIPSDDKKIKALSKEIIKGKKGILQKARAVYDWTVENTRRDPNVPGCGVGKVEATLAARSGKCADISSVFVALARAAGVPAREVFGLRLGRPGETDITDGHHCWAEFYLPGTGWVPVDPADVHKIMLQQNLDLAAAKTYREYYFGAVDEFRIVLQRGGRGLTFSEGNAEKVNYFMYPYAEVDGKPLDYCQPKTFRFTVTFQEDR